MREWVGVGFTLLNAVLVVGIYFGGQGSTTKNFESQMSVVQHKLDVISTEVTSIKVDVARLQERTK